MGQGGEGFRSEGRLTGRAMSFDAFLERAWADHGDRPEEVAARLDEGLALITAPGQIVPFARLVAHVDGEHLAHWHRGLERLARLRGLPAWSEAHEEARLVARLEGALKLGAGEALPSAFDAADRAHAHAVVSSAWLAQGRTPDALAALDAARAAAAGGLADGEPALRALAIAGNNVAVALEALTRSDAQTAAMLAAAATGREYWGRAGGWLETERAEYVLAKCQLAAGDAAAALVHAAACRDLCEANGADDFERFFAQAMMALASRAGGDTDAFADARRAALAHAAKVPDDLRPYCEPDLRLLN